MNYAVAQPSAPGRRAVLTDAIPGAKARDAALVFAGAALTALLAQVAVHVPHSPVPVTGQTLAVGLVGATLGARRGAAALLLYVLAGLVLPVYADATSGWSTVWGPNGGYLVGFVIAAWAIGVIAERGGDRKVVTAFAAFTAEQLIVFAFGLVGLKIATDQDWGWVVHNGFTIFILGGLIKAAVGAAVLPSAWKIVRSVSKDEDR
jgi:biotin transport system substrate-specific component